MKQEKLIFGKTSSKEEWNKLRSRIIDQIWKGMFVIALISAPASISRSLFTGWQYLYTFHLIIVLLIVLVHLFRNELPITTKLVILLVILSSIGLISTFTFGLLGTGVCWLVISCLLVSIFYTPKAGIISAVAIALIVIATAVGFTSGILTLSFNANDYAMQISSWITFLFASALLPFIVFIAVGTLQQSTRELLKKVEEQRDQISQLATHDQLTGLPLMNLAQDRLEMAFNSAQRKGEKVALLFIDLDGFKTVNDTYGHDAGDYVLKEVAVRLKTAIRAEDTAARIGGDEFIIILSRLSNSRVASDVAKKIIDSIARPIIFSTKSLSVGTSIGIALFPDHANDMQMLRRIADKAMYSVKQSGKNNFAFAEKESIR